MREQEGSQRERNLPSRPGVQISDKNPTMPAGKTEEIKLQASARKTTSARENTYGENSAESNERREIPAFALVMACV